MSASFASWIAGTTTQALSALRSIRRAVPSTQTGTTYTLALTDAGNWVYFTNTSGCVVTIPLNDTVGIPVGSFVYLKQRGSGQVTITGASGVSVDYEGTVTPVSARQHSVVCLYKEETDRWTVFGSLEVQ